MTILFRLFVFFGGLFAVALIAALVAPYFVEWDEFTAEFETEASRVLGQPVKVGGETKLRLLPLPYLSFEDLEVGQNSDGTPLMTVENFSFNAELFPFLSGEVRIIDMAMMKPKVNLQVADDGTIAWTNPKELLVNPEQVNIEKLQVEDGTIVVTGLVGNRTLEVENIDASLSAKSILGPWTIEGDADVGGISSTLKISTGTFQEDRSLRLKVEALRLDEPYRLLLDGPVKLHDDALSWAGDFRLMPRAGLDTGKDNAAEPLPVAIEGNFNANPQRVYIEEYRMEVGEREDPYTVTGNANLNMDGEIFFKVEADGRQIDIDRLKLDKNITGGKSLESRLNALFLVLKRIPIPTAKGEIDLVLPAIVAGDTYIRDITSVVVPAGEGWEVRSMRATFPGNTILETKGHIGLRDEFGFSGRILLASRQPSGFAAWMSGNVDKTFRQLKTVGLAADLTISKHQAALENVELRMDDAVLRGKLQRLSSSTGRPAILAELNGNRVNIDDLKAIYSLVQEPDAASDTGHDLNIKVKAGVLEAKIGDQILNAGDVDAHIEIRDGTISVDRLNAGDVLGAKIISVGRIENLLTKPNGNMKLNVLANNAGKLLDFAQQFLGENAFVKNLRSDRELTGNTELNVEIDTREIGEGAKGRMLISGVTGGTDIQLRLGFDGKVKTLTKVPLTVVGKFSNASPDILMRQIGIDMLPEEVYGEIPGPLTMDLDLSGIAEEEFETLISFTGKDSNLSASGKLSTSNWHDFNSSLLVTLGTANLSPYLIASGLPVPGVSIEQELPASISFTMEKQGEDVELANLNGQLSGNAFKGSLKLQRAGVARPRVSGDLVFESISLPLIGEAVFGRNTALGASLGISEDIASSEGSNFGEALYTGLDARLSLSARNVALGEGLSGDDVKFQLVMLDGAIDLNGLSLGFMGGRFEGGINLKNTNGIVLADMNYALSGLDVKNLAEKFGMGSAIDGRITLNGSSQTTGRSFSALVSNLSGNGIIAVKPMMIGSFDPNGFDAILVETGSEGYELQSERVRELVEDSLLVSPFKVQELDAPFSINRGKFRVRNVNYAVEGSKLIADIEADLKTRSMDANTIVSFTPGRRDMIQGAEPQITLAWNGPFNALEQTIDTGRLEGYLSLRAFEKSQRRLETLEAQVIEKQRLRNQIAYAFAREKYQVRKREEELRLEEERQLREAEEALLQEEARKQEEAELEAARLEAERKARELAEAARLEEERKQREAELEAAKLEEERKQQEAELEDARLEEERKARELAEAARLEEEERKLQEAARLEEERKQREAELEAARLEEERKQQEAKLGTAQLEEERKQQEAELEAARLEEERRLNQARQEAAQREEARRIRQVREQAEARRQARLRAQRQQRLERTRSNESGFETNSGLKPGIIKSIKEFLLENN